MNHNDFHTLFTIDNNWHFLVDRLGKVIHVFPNHPLSFPIEEVRKIAESLLPVLFLQSGLPPFGDISTEASGLLTRMIDTGEFSGVEISVSSYEEDLLHIQIHLRDQNQDQGSINSSIVDHLRSQLANITDLYAVLEISLKQILDLLSFDCGGIYLLTDPEHLALIHHKGIPSDILPSLSSYTINSDRYKLLEENKMMFTQYRQLPLDQLNPYLAEKFENFAVLPLFDHAALVGVINVATYHQVEVSESAQKILPEISAIITAAIMRVENQQSILEHQQRLNNLFNEINEFIFLIDLEGNIVDVNAYVTKKLNYTREQLIGQNFLMVHPPALRGDAAQVMEAMMSGITNVCTLPLSDSMGRQIPVETLVATGKWGRQNLIIGISHDRSTQYAYEQQLKESENYFRSLFENNPFPSYVFSPQTLQIIAMNDVGCELFGIDPLNINEGVINLSLLNIHPVDDENLTPNGMIYQNGEVWVQENNHGQRIYLETYTHPIIFNQAEAVLAVAYNISERKQMEESLRLSELRYRQVVEDQTELICRFNGDGMLLFVNESYARFFNHSRSELENSTFIPLVPSEDREIVASNLSQLTAEHPIQLYTHRVIDGTGKIRWTSWTDHATYDESGNLLEIQSVGHDITNERETQTSLMLAEERYRNLVEHLPSTVFLLDFATKQFLYVSPQIETLIGCTPQQIYGDYQLILSHIHPEDRQVCQDTWRSFEKTLDFSLKDSLKYRMIHTDGSEKWVEETMAILQASSGETVLQGIVTDISEQVAYTTMLDFRYRFEQHIAEISTELISVEMDQLGNVIQQAIGQLGQLIGVDRSYIFSLDHIHKRMSNTYEWCNDGIEPTIDMLQDLPWDIFPWWTEKILAKEHIHIPSVNNMPTEAHNEQELLKEQSIQSLVVVPMVYQQRVLGFIGFDAVLHSRRWDSDIIALLRLASDAIVNAMQRNEAVQNLIVSESRSRALLHAIPDTFFLLDNEGQIVDHNNINKVYKTVSNKKRSYIGKYLRDILPTDSIDTAMNLLKTTISKDEIQTHQYHYPYRDQVITNEVRFSKISAHEALAILRDISEQAELEQLKSDFINKSTHELRTPLTTVLLMIDLLEKTRDEPKRLQYWNILKSELNRERLLVEDILLVGRLEKDNAQVHLRKLDPVQALKEAYAGMEPLALDKNIHISLDYGGVQAKIVGDETRLRQVFTNLLHNAVKFTPRGGDIGITVSSDAKNVIISIQDSGIGIDQTDMASLFGRFYRGKNAVLNEIPGSGMGLFIVKSLVDIMHGDISVESAIGEGTRFQVSFPYSTL